VACTHVLDGRSMNVRDGATDVPMSDLQKRILDRKKTQMDFALRKAERSKKKVCMK